MRSPVIYGRGNGFTLNIEGKGVNALVLVPIPINPGAKAPGYGIAKP